MRQGNQILKNVKREIIQRGKYQQEELKSHSFKTFNKLVDSNQMFTELVNDQNSASLCKHKSPPLLTDSRLHDFGDEIVDELRKQFSQQHDACQDSPLVLNEPEIEPVLKP